MSGTPSLNLWRREVRAGVDDQRPDHPASWRLDVLWRAACWEQSAIEADRLGQRDSAAHDRAAAAALITTGANAE